MTDKEVILQTKTRYVNKVKEEFKKIVEIKESIKEYEAVIKDCDNQLEDLIQGKLW